MNEENISLVLKMLNLWCWGTDYCCLTDTCKYVICEKQKSRERNHMPLGMMDGAHQERMRIQLHGGAEKNTSGTLLIHRVSLLSHLPTVVVSGQCSQPNLGRAGVIDSDPSGMKVRELP